VGSWISLNENRGNMDLLSNKSLSATLIRAVTTCLSILLALTFVRSIKDFAWQSIRLIHVELFQYGLSIFLVFSGFFIIFIFYKIWPKILAQVIPYFVVSFGALVISGIGITLLQLLMCCSQ
jgi:hypothetical protein